MDESIVIGNTKALGRDILDFIERSPWRDSYAERIKVLIERADFPCELAIVGQVKAGKSSFLNAFLGDDWAMVGTTETTATINFFKYGVPDDLNRPIRVVWDDGREEWQTREFLDSLQGNSSDVLEKAKGIDHLEYYLQNPILQRITLVDTPGTNAMVDAHNARANEYIAGKDSLREKHNVLSINLKNRADAVIVITERVPYMPTSELIASFSQDTSAFNSIGVMTKIDLEEEVSSNEWERRCDDYSRELRQQLSAIVPVSAQIYRAVKKLEGSGRFSEIASALKPIPESDFEEVCKSRDTFLGNDSDINEYFLQFGLPYSKRKALAGNLDWMVFYAIAKELYRYPVNEAKKRLIDYSGMEKMKTILDQQFFKRSRIIRCSKIIAELHRVLDEILHRRIYYLRRDAKNRQKYLELIDSSFTEEWLKSEFSDFVKENIYTKEQYDNYEKKLQELIRQTEAIQLSFGGTDKIAEGLVLLDKKQDSFSPAELEELEVLFGKYPNQPLPTERKYIAARQLHWRGRKASVNNGDVKRIIELAIFVYGTIKPQ